MLYSICYITSTAIPAPVCVWSHVRIGSSGVEERRGDLGPVAIAPFPLPAHRTGRADFPHPALRLASLQGPRLRLVCREPEVVYAKCTAHSLDGKPPRAAPAHLVPPSQESANSREDMVVDCPVGAPPRTIAEVGGPASQHAVQLIVNSLSTATPFRTQSRPPWVRWKGLST